MRATLLLLYLLVVLAPLHALAEKLLRVGFLQGDAPNAVIDYFKAGMHDLGYTEGRNLVIEERWANGNFDVLPRMARELVDLPVDVIVTGSTPAAVAASKATGAIPIVIGASADPVASGLVSSLAHPGGNITGLTLMLDEISTKRLEILRELVPGAKRIAVLWSSSNPVYGRIIHAMERSAPRLGMQIIALKVGHPNELTKVLSSLERRKSDALFVFEDPLFISYKRDILALASHLHTPAIYGSDDFVKDGGLVSYAPSFEDLYKCAAGVVDRVVKGAKPAELPIEQPTKFKLAINLKTASTLKLNVPETILLRADEVIR